MRRSGRRDLEHKMRAAERERDDTRDRVVSIIRQVDDDEGMVREDIERYQSQGRVRLRAHRGDDIDG